MINFKRNPPTRQSLGFVCVFLLQFANKENTGVSRYQKRFEHSENRPRPREEKMEREECSQTPPYGLHYVTILQR